MDKQSMAYSSMQWYTTGQSKKAKKKKQNLDIRNNIDELQKHTK